MKNFKKLAALILSIMLVLSMTACASGSSDEGGVKLGISLCDGADVFHLLWCEKLTAAAEAEGWEVVVTDALGKVDKQLTDVDSLIVQECDVIVINPANADASIPAVEAVDKAGIYCIVADNIMADDSVPYDVAIKSDGYALGKMQGDYIKKWCEDRGVEMKLGYVIGSYSFVSPTSRHFGCYEALGIDAPAVEGEGQWTAEGAMSLAEDWLQVYPDLNVIACMSDAMASGVIQAYNAAGINMDDVLIVGVDGLEFCASYIRSGDLDASIGRDVDYEVGLYIDACKKLLSGETVDRLIQSQGTRVVDLNNVDDLYPEA